MRAVPCSPHRLIAARSPTTLLPMRILHYDCFAGISGDMHLAALIDLGVTHAHVVRELDRLSLDPFEFTAAPDARNGMSGIRVDVAAHDHRHDRSFADIRALIERAGFEPGISMRALRIFTMLAEAEASVHNSTSDDVHFHEVGAVDSIVDIVGAAVCLDALKPDRITCSPVELGGGTVSCAHGTFPVPAPATAELVKGMPVTVGRTAFESTTPTGAAILSAVVDEFSPRTPFSIEKIGHGIGHREGPLPNVLRVFLGSASAAPGAHEAITVIECTIDDQNPELFDHALDRLFAAGALDVFMTPVTMKKSRLGVTLTVLAPTRIADALAEIVLTETTTLGIRSYQADRTVLDRQVSTIQTMFGPVRVKTCLLHGRVLRSKPEYDDCRKLALDHHVPIQDIYREAARAL